MDKAKISYAGSAPPSPASSGSSASTPPGGRPIPLYNGTADISGQLALAMSVGLFAFGGAYVLIGDARIRRAMGALATLCAVVLTLACVWGLLRTDNIAPGATASTGLFVSALGGVLGIAAGLLVLRDTAAMEAAGSPDAQPSDAPLA